MPLRAHCSLLLAVTALYCIGTVFAIPMTGFDEMCRCMKTIENRISTRLFLKMEIVPAGPHCSSTEIIVTLKDKRVVCVEPEADWIQKVISNAIHRNAHKK
ncbi:hypothetical protein KOW79_018063 [Hemibagrus wyckioides]|uniref:Chemokine interleukin-8-like domain-containing protein n=1 Tax=Hemibagrus wyckioides TaxID=337641 RepID=A0A9D3N8I8_9TELE|nr:interleukin-8 [Hemibagrus wyckioides]KAG7318308.1 hypothetical protein KOW79_018063 [Hemibagrus wyckioides]